VENIKAAIEQLIESDDVNLLKCSSFYKTSPVEFTDQPDFINNVIEVETDLPPEKLLRKIKQLEASVNPVGKIPKGPRVIDLDILFFNDVICKGETLTIPHQAICKRKFVLIPLLEISPDQFCPADNRPFKECLASLDDPDQIVERI